MKNAFLRGCLLLATVSCGLCAQEENEGLISCEIVPIAPFSKSCHAQYTGVKKTGLQLGSKVSKSTNWSGYASFTSLKYPEFDSVSGVRGEWKVPSVHSSLQDSYSAAWVGIDGFFNTTVEQLGTSQGWVNGHADYFTWFSMYPGPSYEILGFPMEPKDWIRAEVTYIGHDVFEMVIRNLSKKVYYVVPSSYTTASGIQRTSAEWIMEAPSNTTILPLVRFSATPFSDCVATIKGKSGKINNSHWKNSRIIMVTEKGKKKAKPSKLTDGGEHFTVKWFHQ